MFPKIGKALKLIVDIINNMNQINLINNHNNSHKISINNNNINKISNFCKYFLKKKPQNFFLQKTVGQGHLSKKLFSKNYFF